MLIDTHTHLASRQFDSDRAEVMSRARAAGVRRVMAPATDLEDCRVLAGIAEANEDVFFAAGIHPCDAHSVAGDDWVTELRKLAAHPKVAAIGEIGLDYYHPPPEGFDLPGWKAHQAHVLRLQLELAAELRLNVVLHNRESWDDLVAQVTPFHGRLRAVFHCYTGSSEQARPLIDAGHLVSFTGIVTFKNPGPAGEAAASLPDGAFMLETDSPYLAPVPYRGKRCEPAYVAETAKAVARLRGSDVGHISEVTGNTAKGFFRGLE